MRDGRTVITLGCTRSFFGFVAGITFFNYRDYIMNKSQTVDCLPTMFLRVRSVTQTNMLVGIRYQVDFLCYESPCEKQLHQENSQTTQL